MFNANPSEIQYKQFNLRYSCSENVYERYLLLSGMTQYTFFEFLFRIKLYIFFFVCRTGTPSISNQIKNWETCHYLSSNIFRKEERDWKMVYLARAEDAETANIAWNFDFTKEKLSIKSVSIKFETKTYENGVIDLQILNEHGELNTK